MGAGNTIDILVRDGVVTLNGTADAEHIRDAVRVAAENAPGAVRVWDNLRSLSLRRIGNEAKPDDVASMSVTDRAAPINPIRGEARECRRSIPDGPSRGYL